MDRINTCLAVLAVIGAVGNESLPAATAYPAKPVRLVVPFPPGGGTDIVSRVIGEKLSGRLGQPVVIDNRGGADAALGANIVAKAPPDGYTLLMGTTTSHTVNPALYKTLPYDPVKEFSPISLVGTYGFLLIVTPSLPVKSVKELIDYARSAPGKLNYASSGSITSLAGELFRILSNVSIVRIPYKGGGPAIVDLIGGHVQMAFVAMPPVLPHVISGKLRGLAVTELKRSNLVPDVPTMKEAGVPGYEVSSWYALLAPAMTPEPIIGHLNREVRSVLQTKEVQASLVAQGADPAFSTPQALADKIKSEIAMWSKVVAKSGMKVD